MTDPQNAGVANLLARAILEHPRLSPGRSPSVTYDVMIRGSHEINDTHVLLCSLRLSLQRHHTPPPPGPYDLEAIVVAFRAGTHEPSPIRVDSDFCLMGEIGTLRPLSNDANNLLDRHDSTARLHVTGKITHVQAHIVAFALSVWTDIPRGAANTHLHIRVFISPRTGWSHPEQRLPCINSIATFFGNLLTMQEDVAIVALDNIVYLPHPGRTGNPLPPVTFPAIQISASD